MARLRRPALLLAFVLAAAPSAAQDYVPPKVGLAIEFDSWRSEENDPAMRISLPRLTSEIIALEGDTARVRFLEGGSQIADNLTLRGIFTYRLKLTSASTRLVGDFAPIRALWPLAPGKSAELRLRQEQENAAAGDGEWKATGRTFVYRYRVEREERVTVPAGQFEAWVILREVTLLIADGAQTRIETSRTWYAPALAWWVKFEHRAHDGGTVRVTVREAARITGN